MSPSISPASTATRRANPLHPPFAKGERGGLTSSWISLLVVLLVAGCASAPLREAPSAAPPAWLSEPAVWRIRQVVLIELGEMQFPVQGLLELDTAAGTVRLAALDDFGVTLFRLTITHTDERVDFILPLVPRGAEVTRSVATSLRRIYLEPGLTASSEGGDWRVWYDEYSDAGGVPVPRLIGYKERGGASLTIRQENVKRVDK